MKVRPAAMVLALCVGSLLGWPPLRSAEQALSPALRLTDDLLVRPCLPDPPAVDTSARKATVAAASAAWEAWLGALTARARPSDAGRQLVVAPVVGSDPARRELIVRVPQDGVAADTPVTHQGVLLGFLRPWSQASDRVEKEGRARVALLGHARARPVAAMWKAGHDAAPVHFLLTHGEAGLLAQDPEPDLVAVPGQVAWTRDVSGLGDTLPPGLLVGRVVEPAPGTDRPGGGLATPSAGRDHLEPVLDAHGLSYIVLEAAVAATAGPSSSWTCRRAAAGLLASSSHRARLRLDRGRWQGVQPGDLVVQGGLLVGVVETAGPFSSVVHRGLPPGRLLVVDEAGDVVATSQDAVDWPAGWRPRPGQLVSTGHRELGGLAVGHVDVVADTGFALRLLTVDPALPVTVIER